MSVTIIVRGKSRLKRQQRACIDYVDKKVRSGYSLNDSKVQEAVNDSQRWAKESGLYKDKTPLEERKGCEWHGTDELKLKK